MRLRKAETDAVRALLDEEWDDQDDLVKALFEKTIELLEQRDSYGLAWGRLAIGPIYDKRAAAKLAAQLDDAAVVAPITAVGTLREWIAKANPVADSQHCAGCRHPKFSHNEFSFNSKTISGCLAKGCSCKEVYRKTSWETKTKLGRGSFAPTQQQTEEEDDE